MLNPIEMTVPALQDAMSRKEITSKSLVLFYLSRIAEIDKRGDGLNAVLEINPDALHIADEMDTIREKGTVLSPVHGIPVLIKDNISTKDKMKTSAGSAALILGKANMIEFANYMSDDMPLGYSSRGGQTLNPYDKKADPSGSSTGSAVAVSAN